MRYVNKETIKELNHLRDLAELGDTLKDTLDRVAEGETPNLLDYLESEYEGFYCNDAQYDVLKHVHENEDVFQSGQPKWYAVRSRDGAYLSELSEDDRGQKVNDVILFDNKTDARKVANFLDAEVVEEDD